MYMREMGTVELLTREGEIAIAKRIEEGIRDMLTAAGPLPRHCRVPPRNLCEVPSKEEKLSGSAGGLS